MACRALTLFALATYPRYRPGTLPPAAVLNFKDLFRDHNPTFFFQPQLGEPVPANRRRSSRLVTSESPISGKGWPSRNRSLQERIDPLAPAEGASGSVGGPVAWLGVDRMHASQDEAFPRQELTCLWSPADPARRSMWEVTAENAARRLDVKGCSECPEPCGPVTGAGDLWTPAADLHCGGPCSVDRGFSLMLPVDGRRTPQCTRQLWPSQRCKTRTGQGTAPNPPSLSRHLVHHSLLSPTPDDSIGGIGDTQSWLSVFPHLGRTAQ